MDSKLLDRLNNEQREAVMHDAGPLLIVAGAGTGKTTVITRRIAWLIEQGRCRPDEILALTFTDKAANEMEERVDRLVPYGYVNLWISTFHGFCERVVKQHALDIGLPTDFVLLDTTTTWLLMRKNLDRFNLEYYRPLGNPTKFIHALIQHFSRAKDEIIGPKQYGEYAAGLPLVAPEGGGEIGIGDEVQRIHEIAAAYQLYEQILLENNALDFGGLISHAIRLFRERPGILEKYRKQFKYMLVDEFQDTNLAQYEIIKILAAPRNNLTVVGDDDQSVYGFRGASVANILDFNTDYPDARQVFLTQNYRSPQNILDSAYGFIQQNNPNRLEYQLQQTLKEGEQSTMSKRLVSALPELGVLEHIHCATLDDEVSTVIQKIIALKEDPAMEWGDFAILARSNDAADPFMARLNELQIPYHFVALKGLYAKPAIIDLICYLKLLNNYHESASLYRVLCWPLWNVSHGSIVELSHFGYKKALTLWGAIQVIDTIVDIPEADQVIIKTIAAGIEKLCAKAKTMRVAEVALHVLKDTGYLASVSDPQNDSERDALSAINQFYSKIKQFQVEEPNGRLKDFMILLSLEQDSGETGSLARDEDLGPDTVKVMTIHSAKGLEFPYVFLVNLVDKRFPTIQRNDSIPLPAGLAQEQVVSGDGHLEEERRLMYVALTRAKKGFFFSSAIDYGGSRKKKLSRFVHELGFATQIAEANPRDLLVMPKVAATIQKEQPPLRLPAVYSFSQLMAFRTCPLQYKFSFLLRIPVFGKPAFSFGKSMHATLEKLFRLMIDSRGNAASIPPLEEVLALYEKNWIGDWYPSKKLHDEYFERGSEMMKKFHADLIANPPSPVDVERDFTIKIGSDAEHFSLKGRIDRIDRAQNGALEIVDYKTGASKAGKLTAEDKEQLLLYQLAAEQTMGEKVDSLTYQYLDDGSKASFVGSPEDLEKLKGRMFDTISDIQKSDFRATPGWSCQFCDFRDICEFRQ